MHLSEVRPLVRLSVCLSVCLSVVQSSHCMPLLQICCCGPDGQKISIDCCMAGQPQPQMRAVPRCKLTRRLNLLA